MRKEENRRGIKRKRRSLREDLPTRNHEKITLQDPPGKDHIAFVPNTHTV